MAKAQVLAFSVSSMITFQQALCLLQVLKQSAAHIMFLTDYNWPETLTEDHMTEINVTFQAEQNRHYHTVRRHDILLKSSTYKNKLELKSDVMVCNHFQTTVTTMQQ